MTEKPTYEELEQRIAQLENTSAQRKRFEEINRTLFKISNAVNTASSLDELYRTIHLALSPVIDTTNFYIALYDRTRDRVTFPYCVDTVDAGYPPVIEVSRTASLTAEVIRTERPVMVTKADMLTRRAKSGLTIPACTPSEIWLGVPLKNRDEIIGVMAVQSYLDPACYDQTDMNVLVSVADQVAVAVERKRAEEAMIRAHDELELRVAERTESLRQANKDLQESEAKHRLLFENANDAIFIVDMKARMLAVNPMAVRQLGYTHAELMSMTVNQVNSPKGEKKVQGRLAKLLEKGHLTFETEHVCRDGSPIPVEISAQRITWEGRPAIMSICRNLTDRKLTEVALRESEEKFRLTYSASPDAVNINRLDDGLYVDINEGFTRATGYTRQEVIGRTYQEIDIWHDPADRQKLVRGLQEKGYYENLEAQFRRKDGSLAAALMSARVISLKGVPHIISTTRDITEHKLIEAKLQQAQKFEAIGTLAGGIAHDFNNLLMGIQGRASLISFDLDVSHPHREHIQAIEEHIRRATSLTQQLLGFARGGKYEVSPVDMNELVQGSSDMFGRTKKEIRIHTKCLASPLVVDADRGQIEQVLLNLYINAWQAMPSEGGELYLETTIAPLDAAYCRPYQTEPGRYVKVSITDTGAGMDEATRQRIFDPFFTTKEKGRGTGLGLASAYGIIKNHGGMITVYSEVGHGTTFNIYLPASDKEAHREVPAEGAPIKGSATILLVDDEEMIIEVGQAMLARLGYRVVVCRGGQEAVNVIKDIGNIIDLVILDLIMPGMDGGTTFDRIREIRPGMPVLLSSGYAINGHAEKILGRGCNGFIQKPYNISNLSSKVRNVLDGKKG